MKTTKFLNFIAIFAAVFMMSCSSSDPETPGGGTGTGTGSGSGGGNTPTPTSIVLTSSKTAFDLGGSVTFTVKTNLNANVTSEAAFKVNGADISGNTYTPATHGAFTVKATYKSLTSNEVALTVNNVITVTSVTVTSDVSALEVGDLVTFTAMATLSDGSTVDKTTDSQFSVDGTDIIGNKHLTSKVGELKAKAVYNGVTSNEVVVQVSQVTIPTTYTKKAIIEDYTGVWCGWCPRVSYAIELVEAETDKVFAVAAHLANNEPLENDASRDLRNAFGVSSFPTAYVNRGKVWTYPEPSNIAEAVDQAKGNTNVGLALNSNLTGGTLDLVVSTGFAQDLSGTKLVVFILENKIILNQANYTSYYAGADPISGFEHNHVLRHSETDVLGDFTITTKGVHHFSYSINLGVVGVAENSNAAVLAMLVDASGKKVLNAQYAKVNTKKQFD